MKFPTDRSVELFSTCPPLGRMSGNEYLARVVDVARWSDQADCKGILVYADNSQVDPWLVAQIIVQHTQSLCPLVAVQPVYMHPYTVAKIIASIGHLYRRRVYLNLVAGGFKNDLLALNDTTPHDERYARLVEYVDIVKRLLIGAAPLSVDGKYYKVSGLKLAPPLPAELFPGIFVSGSSAVGLDAAATIGATAVQYPKPPSQAGDNAPTGIGRGIRVGIIGRGRDEDAWAAAHALFPEDRKGELTRQLATKVSDSVWHAQLSEPAHAETRGPYWLVPFERYQTNCPYLVGSYASVGNELAGYIALGYRRFILDVPHEAEDLIHTWKAFEYALENRRAGNAG